MAGSMAGHDMAKMDMPGMKMDLNDIEYDAYLANDRTLDDPEVVNVERGGGKVRLRIINGAASTVFFIDTGDVDGTLLAVDGQATQPDVGRRFPVSMGSGSILRWRCHRTASPTRSWRCAKARRSVPGSSSPPRVRPFRSSLPKPMPTVPS